MYCTMLSQFYILKCKKKYHTVGAVQNFNRKIEETEAQLIPLEHMYITVDTPSTHVRYSSYP